MTAHRYHPRTESSPLLFDDCHACAEQAANPIFLDPMRLETAWREMTLDLNANLGRTPNSTERTLFNNLYRLFVLAERLGFDTGLGR